jgi:uncharacterized protein (TIGR01244 family)
MADDPILARGAELREAMLANDVLPLVSRPRLGVQYPSMARRSSSHRERFVAWIPKAANSHPILNRVESMSTQDIYNYRKVNDQLITGGQPSQEQLRSAAEEGFTTVINLVPFNPGHSLEDEAGLVRSLGMAYHHIPVDWANPKQSDFQTFERVMQEESDGKMLIHCAANFRVTAFYSLYALKHLGWTEAQADAFRASIWQGSDYPVWEAFIAEMKARIVR